MPAVAASPTLADEIRALSAPGAYPHACTNVTVVQTHFACVFLTDEFAYKLKKPVHIERMDFRTVAARERNCREELRLNRRLAHAIYLDVVALADVEGALKVEGNGAVVDWLVKMRRLPADRMLDRAITSGVATVDSVAAAGQLLARFYRDQPAAIRSGDEYLARMHERVADAREQLMASDLALDIDAVKIAHAKQHAFMSQHADLLAARADAGRIVEGHGDLRPEHVFLGDGALTASVIDCLEFDRDLRVFDPIEELAFLSLECERMGAAHIGAEFVRIYLDVAADEFASELFGFYRTQRALTRAKIAAWHLRDIEVRELADWRALAHSYLRDARAVLL